MDYLDKNIFSDTNLFDKSSENAREVLENFDEKVNYVFSNYFGGTLQISKNDKSVVELILEDIYCCKIKLCLKIETNAPVKEDYINIKELCLKNGRYCLGVVYNPFLEDEQYEEILFDEMWVRSTIYRYYRCEDMTEREECLLADIGMSLETIRLKSLFNPEELNEYEKMLFPLGYVGLFSTYSLYTDNQDRYKEEALEYVRNNGSTQLYKVVEGYLNDSGVINEQRFDRIEKWKKQFIKEILSDDACFYRRLIKDIKKASDENEECPDLKKINTKQIDEIFHEEMFEGEFPLYEHKSKHMIVECFRGKEKDPNNITFAVIKMPKKIYSKFGRVSLQDVFLSKYYKKCKMKTVYFNPNTENEERCNLLVKLVNGKLSKSKIDKEIFIYNGNNMKNTSLLKIYGAAFAGFGLLFSLGMFLFVNGVGVIQGLSTGNWELLEFDPIEWLALAFMSGFMFSTLFFIIIGIIWTYGVIKER